MEDNKLALIIICAVLFAVGLTAGFYSLYIVKEVRLVPMTLSVDNVVGINIDTDKLYFGTTFPGGGSMRNMMLYNTNDIPLLVTVKFSGDFENWVGVSDNNFVLGPSEGKNLTFSVGVPEDAAYGNYNGNAKIIFKRTSII